MLLGLTSLNLIILILIWGRPPTSNLNYFLTPSSLSYDRYSVEGFLDKNRDLLFQDFKRLMYHRCQTRHHSCFSNEAKFPLDPVHIHLTPPPQHPLLCSFKAPTQWWRRCGPMVNSASRRSPSDRKQQPPSSKTPLLPWWINWPARLDDLLGFLSPLFFCTQIASNLPRAHSYTKKKKFCGAHQLKKKKRSNIMVKPKTFKNETETWLEIITALESTLECPLCFSWNEPTVVAAP